MPQCLFILSNAQLNHLHSDARKELQEGIKAVRQSLLYDYEEIVFDIGYVGMGPYYRVITSASSLGQSLLDSMERKNTEELKTLKLDDRLAEAEKLKENPRTQMPSRQGQIISLTRFPFRFE